MNEPRVYKNSPFVFGFLILIVGVLFVGLFASFGRDNWIVMLPFALIFGVIILTVFLMISSKTIISDDEISTQNILGTKTLRWSEIQQVSGRGYGIKLQVLDRNLTVAPSPQLPGYAEVIEWIGIKRSDLFNPMEYPELSRSPLQMVGPFVIGLLFMGAGYVGYTRESGTLFPFLIFGILGLIVIGTTLLSPRSVSIQGNTIVIRYLFNQKTYRADEIASVDLRFTQTRNGKQYFTVLNLASQKTIRIAGFSPNLPVVYLVLKNWHRKNARAGQIVG